MFNSSSSWLTNVSLPVFCVHREAVEVLTERPVDRHRVRIDDVASESLQAGCASLVTLSLPLSFCEAFVPRDLAAASVDAILSGFRACREAGHDLDSLLLVLQARQIRAHAPPCCPRHPHQCCHTCCPSYQARPPAAVTCRNC